MPPCLSQYFTPTPSTSAVHPVLRGLLHYIPSVSAVADERLEEIKMHSRAVNQGKGVWANAVFGQFNNRGVRHGLLDFTMLLNVMEGILLP